MLVLSLAFDRSTIAITEHGYYRMILFTRETIFPIFVLSGRTIWSTIAITERFCSQIFAGWKPRISKRKHFYSLLLICLLEGALTVPDDTNRPREALVRVWSGDFPAGSLASGRGGGQILRRFVKNFTNMACLQKILQARRVC